MSIPLLEPNCTGKEAEYVALAISKNQIAVGDFIGRFEEMVSKASGARGCVAVSSGTAALHLALLAAGAVAGTQIKCPAYTFVATANAIRYCGSEPVFTDDYEPPARLTFAGNVIYDAAGCIGMKLMGRAMTFSFNGNKTVTCGSGGAVVSDDMDFLAHVRHLANQCKVGSSYRYDGVGFNYRMANVNAAIGCAQMERLDEFLSIKADIARRYRAAFGKAFPFDFGGTNWLNVGSVQYRKGITYPFWTRLDGGPNRSVMYALPSSTTLTGYQQDRVIEALCELL